MHLSPFEFISFEYHLAELEKLAANPLPYHNQSSNTTHASAVIDPVIEHLSARPQAQEALESFKKTLLHLYRAKKSQRNDALVNRTKERLHQQMINIRLTVGPFE